MPQYGHYCTILELLANWLAGQTLLLSLIEICYKPGHQNVNADALSRSPITSTGEDSSLEVAQVATANGTTADPILSPIIDSLLKDEANSDPKFVLIH